MGWYTTIRIHFRGLLPCNGILPGAKFTLRPSLVHSPIFTALLHGTQVVGVRQTLRRSVESATYIRQRGHHVGDRPTFLVIVTVYGRPM